MNFITLSPYIKSPKLGKVVWVSLVASLLTAFGLTLVTVSGTPLLNLGSYFGIAASLIGTYIGLAVLLLANDYLRGGKLYYWDALLGALGGTLALSLFAVALGAVFTTANIVGLILGFVLLAAGIYVGVEVGDKYL